MDSAPLILVLYDHAYKYDAQYANVSMSKHKVINKLGL